MWPELNPAVDAIYEYRLLLFLSLVLRGYKYIYIYIYFFFLGGGGEGGCTLFFSSPQKPTLTNSIQFDLERTSY